MQQFFLALLGIRSDFERIFFINEYRALLSRNRQAIIGLHIILVLTYAALGFAIGSLDNLKLKMDNPFTNWVDLEVRESAITEKIPHIIDRYSDPERSTPLMMKGVEGYSMFTLDFYKSQFEPLLHPPDSLITTFWGRTLTDNDELLDKILDIKGNNLIWGADTISDEDTDEHAVAFDDCSIIVTHEMMGRLGYAERGGTRVLMILDEETAYKSDGSNDFEQRVVFLQVAAVVRELPGFADFITSPKIYNILKFKKDGIKSCQDFLLRNRISGNRFMFLSGNSEFAEVQTLVDSIFENRNPSLSVEETVTVGVKEFEKIVLSFLPTDAPDMDLFQYFVSQGRQRGLLTEMAHLECVGGNCNAVNFGDFHHLAFHFDRLDQIRTFREDMFQSFAIPIDMGQVETKENFLQVTQLTTAISLILIVFGILSIILFVNNVLKSHLQEVRSNLGTFQAFGLDEQFLMGTYLKIIFSYLVLAITVTFGVVACIDFMEEWQKGADSRFDVFNLWVFLSSLCLLAFSLFISSRTIRSILGDTPGNLIYNR